MPEPFKSSLDVLNSEGGHYVVLFVLFVAVAIAQSVGMNVNDGALHDVFIALLVLIRTRSGQV